MGVRTDYREQLSKLTDREKEIAVAGLEYIEGIEEGLRARAAETFEPDDEIRNGWDGQCFKAKRALLSAIEPREVPAADHEELDRLRSAIRDIDAAMGAGEAIMATMMLGELAKSIGEQADGDR